MTTESDRWPSLYPETVKVVPTPRSESEPATVRRIDVEPKPEPFPVNVDGVRAEIVAHAADHLFAALDEFTEGVRWLELVEPGSLDRWREVRVRMAGLCDHADELVHIGTNEGADG